MDSANSDEICLLYFLPFRRAFENRSRDKPCSIHMDSAKIMGRCSKRRGVGYRCSCVCLYDSELKPHAVRVSCDSSCFFLQMYGLNFSLRAVKYSLRRDVCYHSSRMTAADSSFSYSFGCNQAKSEKDQQCLISRVKRLPFKPSPSFTGLERWHLRSEGLAKKETNDAFLLFLTAGWTSRTSSSFSPLTRRLMAGSEAERPCESMAIYMLHMCCFLLTRRGEPSWSANAQWQVLS